MSGAALIWCPFGDEASAHAAAVSLVDERLVACANVVPGVTSIYCWQGQVMQGREVAVLFKTTSDLLEVACQRLEDLHPYAVPAIVAWHADRVPQATLDWLAGQVRQEDQG